MLRHPHTTYRRLFVYYLDRLELPVFDHPDLIGVWVEDQHAILFFHSDQEELVAGICKQARARIIYKADMEYRDWEAGVVIGPFGTKTLSVRPVWDERHEKEDGRQEIVLDPSVIFGSGFHPTTRLCLETLELAMLESGRKIRRVADLGTGTGLLAVAAAKLGAEKVLSLDNNPLACEVARSNVARNKCEKLVEVLRHDLTSVLPDLEGYDLVVANLYKGLLLRLFADPGFWKAGMYMISGIIPSMEGELLGALPQKGVRFLHRGNSGIWRLWLLDSRAAEAQVNGTAA